MNEIIINVDKEKKMIEKNLHVNTLIICVKKTNIWTNANKRWEKNEIE